MLGHASAAMTFDVYADLFDDDLDAVGTALDVSARGQVVGYSWGNGVVPPTGEASDPSVFKGKRA